MPKDAMTLNQLVEHYGQWIINTFDNEEGCTWRQIPAKVICLYILEESFCPFH
jgi:hypothetical protein